MLSIRPANSRGHVRAGWLNSHHSFSFGHYYDPQRMGWSVLRVINDDTVAAHSGFDPHSHRDMEIISYVLQGAIRHEDSMGNVSVLRAGEVQRMSAGTGVVHSEYNVTNEPLKFLQIWILPAERYIEPGYEQKSFGEQPGLTPLVTPDGRQQSLRLHQDAGLFRVQLAAGESLELGSSQRRGYLHVISGEVNIQASDNTEPVLGAGDAVALDSGDRISLQASEDLHALWFDLP